MINKTTIEKKKILSTAYNILPAVKKFLFNRIITHIYTIAATTILLLGTTIIDLKGLPKEHDTLASRVDMLEDQQTEFKEQNEAIIESVEDLETQMTNRIDTLETHLMDKLNLVIELTQ
jgi:hypothetical protein